MDLKQFLATKYKIIKDENQSDIYFSDYQYLKNLKIEHIKQIFE